MENRKSEIAKRLINSSSLDIIYPGVWGSNYKVQLGFASQSQAEAAARFFKSMGLEYSSLSTASNDIDILAHNRQSTRSIMFEIDGSTENQLIDLFEEMGAAPSLDKSFRARVRDYVSLRDAHEVLEDGDKVQTAIRETFKSEHMRIWVDIEFDRDSLRIVRSESCLFNISEPARSNIDFIYDELLKEGYSLERINSSSKKYSDGIREYGFTVAFSGGYAERDTQMKELGARFFQVEYPETLSTGEINDTPKNLELGAKFDALRCARNNALQVG